MNNNFLKEFNEKIKSILELNNQNIILYSDKTIYILKYPKYEISFIIQNEKFISINYICEYKPNILFISTNNKIQKIELKNNNSEYEILSSYNIQFNCYKLIPLKNSNKILYNSYKSFSIIENINEHTIQLNLIYKPIYSFFSIFQINENKLVISSYFEKSIKFLNITFWTIISIINNIDLSLNNEIFCMINNDILAVGGDLRSGIYFIDVKNHILKNQYKNNFFGYTILLNLENERFLGESFSGRYYGESDDEEEDLLCTEIYKYDNVKIEPKLIKSGIDRNNANKRSFIIKLKNCDKIAYFVDKILYIENF